MTGSYIELSGTPPVGVTVRLDERALKERLKSLLIGLN
jgi:hypothetical protein